jgi:hypothetical protein
MLLDTMKSLEHALSSSTWHSGVREARLQLKKKMLAHIVEHYPAPQDAVDVELAALAQGGETR